MEGSCCIKTTSLPPASSFGGVGHMYGTSSCSEDSLARDLPAPDILVRTSGGLRIPVHSSILAMASPVLESIMDQPRKHRSSERVIPILGVPCEAVAAFIGYLYTRRCSEEQMEKFGIHLLALSHVYSVPQLKQRCTKGLAQRLSIENVVDVLQLARLCDAPDLYLKGMKLVYSNIEAVENTEGWKFMSYHDPWLELEILQFIDERELRRKKTRRCRQEQRLYLELSEAMECLEHIFTEGCTTVGPCDAAANKKREPCTKFAVCRGLQLLIRHFAGCRNRLSGGCLRCKRMLQLLRLHASICDETDFCKVPLCRQSKLRQQQEEGNGRKREDRRWKLLVKKVMAAKVMSSLAQTKRKRQDDDAADSNRINIANRGFRSFRLY